MPPGLFAAPFQHEHDGKNLLLGDCFGNGADNSIVRERQLAVFCNIPWPTQNKRLCIAGFCRHGIVDLETKQPCIHLFMCHIGIKRNELPAVFGGN